MFDPRSKTYNPRWKFHESFSYTNKKNILDPLEMLNKKAPEAYPRAPNAKFGRKGENNDRYNYIMKP